jgi:hypothetical protein
MRIHMRVQAKIDTLTMHASLAACLQISAPGGNAKLLKAADKVRGVA